MEREEFYRLKKVQDKKKALKAKVEAARQKLIAEGKLQIDEDYTRTVLDEGDEDILFS